MISRPTLNRVDGIVLSLTASAVGVALLYDAAALEACGVAIIGLGIAWALGHRCRVPAFPELNSRHKSVLLLTILAVGLSLALGESLKFSLGILSIGLPVSWVVGSNMLAAHVLLAVLGASISAWAATAVWREHVQAIAECNELTSNYLAELERFRSQLPGLAKLYPLDQSVLREAPFRVVDSLPVDQGVKAQAYFAFYEWDGLRNFGSLFDKIAIPEEAKAKLLQAEPMRGRLMAPLDFPSPLPEWAAEALAAHVDVVSWNGSGSAAVKRILTPALSAGPCEQPGPFVARLRRRLPALLPGLLLMAVGLFPLLLTIIRRVQRLRAARAQPHNG